MPFPARYFVVLAVALAWVPLTAQTSTADEGSPGTVRLEAHDGKTEFAIDEPIYMDLVFKGHAAGYSVETGSNPAQPIGDTIYVSPDGGWVRTHQSLLGKSIDGNALVPLGGEQVRVPVLVSRVILFQKPGDYDISVATQRVVSKDLRRVEQFENCDPCPATNSVRIHLFERTRSEEAALLTSLSQVLERTHTLVPGGGITAEEKEEATTEFERVQQMPDTREKEKREKLMLQKISRMAEEMLHEDEKRQADRLLAAQRLAYLPGDDALRAKIHFIAEVGDGSDGDLVGFIMVDGLAASRNKQLQLDLLKALWHDPGHVPSHVLHDALFNARSLIHDGIVKDDWGMSTEERKAYWGQYTKDLDELVATLPSRSEPTREQTIEFLKNSAVPNRIKQAARQP
jgi:hypothetical protein